MRVGFTVSALGHIAVFGLGFFSFFEGRPLAPVEIEALPVELIDVAEVTDLLEGDKESEILPEETPQPKPEIEAEVPTLEPVEEPAPRPVEAALPPQPKPEPTPEPVVEPEPEEVAALPAPEEPEAIPEAEPEPAPQMPVESRPPRPRPEPPRQLAEPEPQPEQPDPIRELAEQQPEEEFDANDIAALLDKQDPAGGGDPQPAPEPQTIGSIEGHVEAAMTQSELAMLSARIGRCWNPPTGALDAGGLQVEVLITFLPDGSLAAEPQVLGVGLDARFMAAADAARRAVIQCAPYGDIFPPEKIALMPQGMILNFDPRLMLGG
jgi:hypothetical protein